MGRRKHVPHGQVDETGLGGGEAVYSGVNVWQTLDLGVKDAPLWSISTTLDLRRSETYG